LNDIQQKQRIIEKLVRISTSKGYISFNDILDIIELFNLPIEEVDSISGYLLTIGCIIREVDTDTGEGEVSKSKDRSKLNYDDIFKEVIELDDSLEMYLHELKTIQPPGNKEVESIIYQAKEGNIYAKNRIISMYLKVVVRMALWASKKYRTPIASAIQNGNLGLIIALEKYQPDGQYKFAIYASWWIRQSFSRRTPIINTDIYLPAYLKESLFDLYELVFEHDCDKCNKDGICKELIIQVMERLDVNYETANRYIEYLHPFSSLDEAFGIVNEEVFSDNGLRESEMIETIDFKIRKNTINLILSELKPREREVLDLRFGLSDNVPRTLEAISIPMGVTRERIRQIEVKAINKLRHQSRSRILKKFY